MKKYLIAGNILLLTALSFFSVKAFYQVLGTIPDFQPIQEAIVKPSDTPDREKNFPPTHYDSIIKRNLFRTENMEKKETAPIPEPDNTKDKVMKETGLKLKLWGTVSGTEGSSYAIIEDPKKKKQSIYEEGDSIEDAVIKRVLNKKIILSVNGVDEFLELEKKTGTASRDKRRRGPAKRPSLSSRGSNVPGENIRVSRTEIDQAVSNVNAIMKQARIRPHYRNGKPEGIRISRIKPDSIFSKLGLRSGDVIIGVDGKKIESVDDALGFYRSLKSSSNVSVQIRRAGREKSLDYNIE